MEQTVKRIAVIINEIRDEDGLDTININADMRLREDIGFDSLGLARLTVAIEDEFEVDIFEDGIVNSIKEIVDKIIKKAD